MNNKGFTLLEMVVVVMIISILFLLTIPNISKVMGSVDAKGCDALTKVVDSAIVQYRLDNGSFPASVGALVDGGYLNSEQTSCSSGEAIVIEGGHATYR
ncbi:MAG: competence type IV pilus major pilin ComGC [Erysipelotrichaceae bacterium]|nr:competence type IV pilus major pilin ComGC [Erysipelotrichaceae bacterium]